MEKEQNDIKSTINKKYEMLLARIVELKKSKEQEDEKTITSTRISDNEIRKEIKLDIDNSKIFGLQEGLENLRENVHNEVNELNDKISKIQSRLEEYHEKIDYQIYEFKSQTQNDVNNTIKEFQNFDRELKRYKDLFRVIQIHSDTLQNNANKTIDVNQVNGKNKNDKLLNINASPTNRKQKIVNNSNRHKASKSMWNQQNIINISKEIDEEDYSDFEDDVNNKQFPKILPSTRVHYNSVSRAQAEINRTLQDIHQEHKKKLKLKFGVKQDSILSSRVITDHQTMKYISEKFKPIRNRGQSVTPMKVDLNSKIHVSLHNLF